MKKLLSMNLKLVFFFLIAVAFTQLSFGQLSNFTLLVTSTNETCTANGALTFSVSGTTTGSTIIYSIYQLPNSTTPIAVINGNNFTGLVAGNYSVVATQSLGNQSGTQQQNVLIENQVIQLSYQISGTDEICGNDGKITIITTAGVATFYEIFAGPIVAAIQTSNVFTGLIAGQYSIRVFNNCGEGVVQTYTLSAKNPALIFINSNPTVVACNLVSIGFNISTAVASPIGVIKYPIQVVTIITPQNGTPIVTTNTILSGNIFSTTAPLLIPQPYSFSFSITDGCGVNYIQNGTVSNLSNSVTSTLINVNCITKKIFFKNLNSLILIAAPATYPNALPQNFTSQIINHSYITQALAVGTYTFTAVNLCGESQILTITIIPELPYTPYSISYDVTCNQGSLAFFNVSEIVLIAAPNGYSGVVPFNFSTTINESGTASLQNIPLGSYSFSVEDTCGNVLIINATINVNSPIPTHSILPNCTNNTHNIKIQGQLNSVILTVAPLSFNTTLPQNFSSQVMDGTLILENLTSGTYTFLVTNSCNNVNTLTIVIPILQEFTNVNVVQNCGSFNLGLYHTSNNQATCTYWLQKFYPNSSDWGNPNTGNLQASSIPNSANAITLTNNFLNLNLQFSGQFRVVKVQPIFVSNPEVVNYCFKILHEFQINGQPEIIEVNSISCNGTFNVIVNAVGLAPLTYIITTKNGLPFLINNANSNLFTNLESAIYNFQVIDFCGNILNSLFEINVPNPLAITATNLCPNQSGTLMVPNFNFLTYQWYNNTNPSVILSTTNTLNFNNFNPDTAAGNYTVSIIYTGNPNSCLNSILTYTIIAEDYDLNAGTGTTISYCGNQGTIDLFTLLLGTYDNGGIWEETTNSGTLIGNLWNSTTVLSGNFQFKYKVTAPCAVADEAIVNIIIKAIPETPVAFLEQVICDTQSLNLQATTVPNVTYQWSGPNGFTSNEQNPIINPVSALNNGMYSVKVIENGCESSLASVEVVVNSLPQFTLESSCVENAFTIMAIPINNSFDVNQVNYSWIGPNGFESSTNPIVITGLFPGNYSLTVTNVEGCFASNSTEILNTLCAIPQGVSANNDGNNDSFNLSGFGIVPNVKIFNRYGMTVFEQNNYINQWHGQDFNNNELPSATYYYLLKLASGEVKSGWVYLTRKD